MEVLQIQWVRLLDRGGVSPADAYPVFDHLVAAYAEPWRYYHTLEHIAETLKVLTKLLDQAEDAFAIMLACWFHDAVYDAQKHDNEAQSAELAMALLRPIGVAEVHLQRIDALIRATAHFDEAAIVGDAVLLVDADLAILGSAEVRYQRYANDIRREYAHVPDADYQQGRLRVLRNFLAQPQIYHTERMFAVGEEPARANLQAEIARLVDPQLLSD